jgi:hypothetical protein
MGADCATDHYVEFAIFRERLTVSKQTARWCNGEIFHLRKLNELEVRKQYQNEITNMFAVLDNCSDSERINRAWEHIKGNIKASTKESLGLHELKQHKPWFDEECLHFLDQRSKLKCSSYRI